MNFLRKKILLGIGLIALLVAGYGVYSIASTWGDVNRVTIERPADPDVPLAAGEDDVGDDPTGGDGEDQVTVPPSADGLDVFLIVGSDSRESLETTEGFGDFGGQRADVVMVMIHPRDGSDPAVLSIPRDLLVPDVCTGGVHRINDALDGCAGSLNGPSELTITVEGLTGLNVDHFAMADLAGFQDVVDEIGGYEICVENAVRDDKAGLELPAGCTQASGEESLAWLRSRRTQELTDSGWRTMSGVSDLTRNERQREFMVEMMSSVSDFSSPQEMLSLAGAIAPHITVDSGLSLFDAVGLAWTLRGLGSVQTLEVPVGDAMSDSGAAVLVATTPVSEIVAAFLDGSSEPSLSIG